MQRKIRLLSVFFACVSAVALQAEAGVTECPAYPANQHLFQAGSPKNWQDASRMVERIYGGRQQVGGSTAIQHNNFIDDYILGAMEADGIPHANLTTDEELIRRVYLDITGRLPSSDDVRQFVSQPDPMGTKRADLIASLIGTEGYVDRWTQYFSDMQRNTYLWLWDARSIFHEYLKNFVANNRPYDQVVTEMITAQGTNWIHHGPPDYQIDNQNGQVNFLARNWENMANQLDVIDNHAVYAGKMFLGIPDLCISCHNGAGHLGQVNLYLFGKRRQDFHGEAAFFSGLRYSQQQADERANIFKYTFTLTPTTGYPRDLTAGGSGFRPPRTDSVSIVPPAFLITGEAPNEGEDFQAAYARILVGSRQFAKATVNYLWKEMFGMGVVDPPDAFDLARQDPANPPPEPWTIQPTNPALLEALADDFIANGYDIRREIQLIANSAAYQLSASFPTAWDVSYAPYFARRFAKRMTPEMVLDAVYQATNLTAGLPGTGDPTGFRIEDRTNLIGVINWAMKLPDPMEPRTATSPYNNEIGSTRNFLNLFNRGDRDESFRSLAGSMMQALSLMNDAMIVNRIRSGRGGTVTQLLSNPDLTDSQLIDELFVRTLSRVPTDAERTQALTLLASNRAQGAETLALVLINTMGFFFY